MSVTPEHLKEIADDLEVGPRPEDPYAGPSSAIDAELQSLGPGDEVRLASLLRQYPDQQQYILSVAASRCGNSTVQRALQNANEYAAQSDAASEDVAEVSAMSSSRTAWEQGAIQYNAAHQPMVDEFNALTSNVGVGGNGMVDPQLVATWQNAHGVDPDGRIGPNTLAAAKSDTSKASDETAATPEPTEEDNFDDINGSALDSRTYE